MTHSTIDTPERGDAINRYGPTVARPAPAETRRLDSRTIDLHAHAATAGHLPKLLCCCIFDSLRF